MSATVLSLAHEAESRHWDAVVESDRLMTLDYVRRAQSLCAVLAAGRAAGRREFVSCEVAAALCVDERTADALLAEAELLQELPPIGEAMQDGRLRLPQAKVLLVELLPLETRVALEVVAAVLGKAEGRTPAQFRASCDARSSASTPTLLDAVDARPSGTAGCSSSRNLTACRCSAPTCLPLTAWRPTGSLTRAPGPIPPMTGPWTSVGPLL
jgi:hypothetical protein